MQKTLVWKTVHLGHLHVLALQHGEHGKHYHLQWLLVANLLAAVGWVTFVSVTVKYVLTKRVKFPEASLASAYSTSNVEVWLVRVE